MYRYVVTSLAFLLTGGADANGRNWRQISLIPANTMALQLVELQMLVLEGSLVALQSTG